MKVQHKEKRGICGICPSGCWVIAEFDNLGRISRLRPDEGSPMGILCRLGEHGPDWNWRRYRKDSLCAGQSDKEFEKHHQVCTLQIMKVFSHA